MRKSNVAITMIRTGHGDGGDTKLGGKQYRKGHSIVQYSAALDTAQSFTAALPKKWGDFQPRDIMQEALFRLGAAIGSRKPKDQEVAFQELSEMMEAQIDHIAGGLEPLDTFLRVGEATAGLHQLRASIREAEVKAVAARDYLELESKELSETTIYMLERGAKLLNIASDWVFAFVWVYSTSENNKIIKDLKWVPWPEERFRGLNV